MKKKIKKNKKDFFFFYPSVFKRFFKKKNTFDVNLKISEIERPILVTLLVSISQKVMIYTHKNHILFIQLLRRGFEIFFQELKLKAFSLNG